MNRINEELKEPSNILYHYCDSGSFLSICKTRKIWFNDLFHMNDSLEMHWGYHIWEKVANILIPKYGRDFIDEIDIHLRDCGYKILLLSTSFTTEKDVLSQWRGYADDGKGYVIGFSCNDLMNLPVRKIQIIYDENAQIHRVKLMIEFLHSLKESDYNEFVSTCYEFGCELSSFKNPLFYEEKEIRLIHALNFIKTDYFLKLVDGEGSYFGTEYKAQEIQFRMKDNIPTPYIELDFSNNNLINPIKEVIVGPKNMSLISGISIFLETIGLNTISISRSKLTYI